jgi:hypothetical protein
MLKLLRALLQPPGVLFRPLEFCSSGNEMPLLQKLGSITQKPDVNMIQRISMSEKKISCLMCCFMNGC